MTERRLAKDAGVVQNNEFSINQLKAAFLDWHTYVWMLMNIGGAVPLYSMSLFLPSIMSGLGFVAVKAQLMTVPVYICSCTSTILFAFNSDRVHERAKHIMVASLMAFVCEYPTISPSSKEDICSPSFHPSFSVHPSCDRYEPNCSICVCLLCRDGGSTITLL